jgi:hypothetical protein
MILGVAFIIAAAVAVLSSKNCKKIPLNAIIDEISHYFPVKPKDLVLLRGFICFASLCQLVMSLNVMHHLSITFKISNLMSLVEVRNC